MSGRVLVPPTIQHLSGPMIFLAGPIQGAIDWQSTAIEILQHEAPNVHVASPRREYFAGEFVYDEQVDWETHHLFRAGREGAILFWLAQEAEHSCERAFAQTTRFELAEWKMRHQIEGVRVVVGIEEGFTGARYIRRRLMQDCPKIPVLDSLEATCLEACSEL